MDENTELKTKWETDKNYRIQVVRELEWKYGRMTGQAFHQIVD